MRTGKVCSFNDMAVLSSAHPFLVNRQRRVRVWIAGCERQQLRLSGRSVVTAPMAEMGRVRTLCSQSGATVSSRHCMYYLSCPFGVCRKLAPHLWQFFGMPSRTCQPRLARQFGQRFVNWSRHNTIAAPNSVPIKLSWVRLEISKNSITPIATNTKSQKAISNPIVALWCWRNFFRSLTDIRFSLDLSHAPLSAVSWGCEAA